MLNTDQGIRGLLFVTNDICNVMADTLELEDWFSFSSAGADDVQAIDAALEDLNELPVAGFLDEFTLELARFDWRTSAADGLTEDERVLKAAYRGSGGYRVLRMQLLRHLKRASGCLGNAASEVSVLLGFEQE